MENQWFQVYQYLSTVGYNLNIFIGIQDVEKQIQQIMVITVLQVRATDKIRYGA